MMSSLLEEAMLDVKLLMVEIMHTKNTFKIYKND